MKLTTMEIKILNAMRNNEFNDALAEDAACGTWCFTAIDNSGIPEKQARGVISSLIQKGLVVVDGEDNPSKGENKVISFTKRGVKLFDNVNGEECSWGGQKLIELPIEESRNISYNKSNETNKEMLNMNYENMKSVELKKLAKENQVPNWWNLKKAEIIEYLTEIDKNDSDAQGNMTESKETKKETRLIVIPQPELKPTQLKDKEIPQDVPEDVTSLQDILKELNSQGYSIKGAKARRILRGCKSIRRPYKNWEWNTIIHNDIILDVKKILKDKSIRNGSED